VRSRLRALGVVGAILLLVGVSLVGTGFAIAAFGLSSEISCGTNCHSAYENLANDSVAEGFFESFGVALSAAGAALLLGATVQFMDRWPRTLAPAPPAARPLPPTPAAPTTPPRKGAP